MREADNEAGLHAAGRDSGSRVTVGKELASLAKRRVRLRACEWIFLKRAFPSGFDLGRSSNELKTILGYCAYLVESEQNWCAPWPPERAAALRVTQALADIVRHQDYQKLCHALTFIVEARATIGALRYSRTECAVCLQIKILASQREDTDR